MKLIISLFLFILISCEKISKDNVIDKFIKLCNRKNIHLLLPIFEKKGKKFHNSAIVISPNHKVIGIYRKQYLPEETCYHEKYYFSSFKNTKNERTFRS